MQITTEQIQANVPVTILRLSGDLDGSNYRDVIAKAQELHGSGARHLIIDLTNVPFMSSAGIVALHNAALLFGGKEAPDVENGWRALKAVSSAEEAGMQAQVKLLNPEPRVTKALDQTGLLSFFPVFEDEAAAVGSF
jgi:anti-anti-sigma regulatory factor